jgi:uncharacterized membrane protein YraQ (UPF0718 family)
MKTWQTVVAVIVIIALLYVAFIVGAVIIRILFGLLAIIVAGWLVRRFVVGSTRGRTG